MKVILLNDVKGLGKKGQVVDASDGYARNFLLPKKMAIEATESNVSKLNYQKDVERKKKLEEVEKAQEIANDLFGKEIIIHVKAGENGKIYGAVSNKDVADALMKNYNISIDKKKISLDSIKTMGTYDAEIKIYPEISTKIKVVVKEE